MAFGLGRFVAVGDGGVIITSTNSGQDWQALQFPSSIYFTRVNFANGQFFATGRQFGAQLGSFEGLLWSSADGVNWVPRYAAENAVVWGVAYGASRYIAIAVDAPSNTARALSSFDGTQWTSTVIPGNGWLYDITFGNGVFVAVGPPTQIDLFGETGATYRIEFTDQPGTMGWQTLQQVVVSSSPHTVADSNPPPRPFASL